MLDTLSILGDNAGFVAEAYGMNSMIAMMLPIILLDLVLKGWALWRSARMHKKYWFIALLLINSAGIFPGIFLFMTNTEYKKKCTKSATVA
ncbi:MAG: hypothetical protein KAS32_02855 [Candidatus Peribacteraceae bacterium]|nr:hypothetical protein [Candidatus Peribacteraceae bacterium]